MRKAGIVENKIRLSTSFSDATSPKRLPPRHKITRDCPRVTVRFSRADYEKLQELADGMALGVYLRAVALNRDLPKRKGKSRAPVTDKAAMSQVLGLLGQSRIANNLNQLAYHTNVGTLVMDETSKAQIEEAYACVVSLRTLLLLALGKRR